MTPISRSLSSSARRSTDLAYRSNDADTATGFMPSLKFFGAIYKRYGGKVTSTGLGTAPVEALDKLSREMERAAKIVILDETLKLALRRRIDDELASELTVPPERVNFKWPFCLDFELEDVLENVAEKANPNPAPQP
jgi:hypothetical protein